MCLQVEDNQEKGPSKFSGAIDAATADRAMRWKEATDSEGNTYYYHDGTKEVRWDKPLFYREDPSKRGNSTVEEQASFAVTFQEADEQVITVDRTAEEEEDVVRDVVNPTELFVLIQQKNWSDALRLVKNNTRDVKVWVSNGIRSPRSTTWKVLPLHTAIILGAPFDLVLEIMNAYPQALTRKDINGSLPIHLAACNLHHSDGERIFRQLLSLHPPSRYAKDRDGNTPSTLLQRHWSESMNASRRQGIIDLIDQESFEGIEALIESRDDDDEESSSSGESVLFPVEALEIKLQMHQPLKSVSSFTSSSGEWSEAAKSQMSFEKKERTSLAKDALFRTLASGVDCRDDSEAVNGAKKQESQSNDGASQISSSTGINSLRKRLKKANTKLQLTTKIAASSPVRLMRKRNGDYLSLSHLGDHESPTNDVETSQSITMSSSLGKSSTDDCTPSREQLLRMARLWKAAVDKKTGETYYYHRQTRQVKWSKPALFDEAQWSKPPLFSQAKEEDDPAKETCKPWGEQDVVWGKENNELVAFRPASRRCKPIPKAAMKCMSPKKRNAIVSSKALVAKQLNSASTSNLNCTPGECERDMSYNSLDEADGLTQLLRSIQQRDWHTALHRAASCPHEASVWVEKTVRGYLLWRYLPIHASIVLHAPVELVAELLRAYPDAARLRDYTANLPIHIAARRINENKEMAKIYNHLFQAFPESIVIEDGKGRTAHDLLKKNGRGAYEFFTDDSTSKDKQKRIQTGQKCEGFSLQSNFTAFSDNAPSVLDPIEDHHKIKSGYIHVKFEDSKTK